MNSINDQKIGAVASEPPAIAGEPPVYVINASNAELFGTESLGGKAHNLFKLRRAGLSVPAFFCINARAYRQCTEVHADKIRSILKRIDFQDAASVSAASTEIKQLIMTCDLLPVIEQQIASNLGAYQDHARFSVRSSAASEDGSEFSFAGQLGTWLNVSKEQVHDAIKRCWASAYEPGVLGYLHRTSQLSPLDNPVSVVIQRMVESQSAGVLFQADPRGNLNYEVINAAYGLGEGVVANKVETDLYIYDKLQKSWQLEIHTQSQQLVSGDDGVIEQEVPADRAGQAVLNESQRAELIEVSAKISSLYARYQDIEWSFDAAGKLHILQSRPITTIPDGHYRMFDNSNIAESYPGVVLPMTFSLFRMDYTLCVTQMLTRFGIANASVLRLHEQLDHMIGYIQGRAYYNMNNWYQVLSLVPFFKKNLTAYFEQMIGSDGAQKESLGLHSMPFWERLQTSVRVPILLPYYFFRVNKLVDEYFVETNKLADQVLIKDASSDQMIARLYRHARRFMELLHVPIMNDVFVMISMALCREQFKRSGLTDSDSLLNELLSNQDIASSKPVELLNQLAEQLRNDPPMQQVIKNQVDSMSDADVGQVSNHLISHGYGKFSSELVSYIECYAHRCPRELIMEANTYRESPTQLLSLLLQLADKPAFEADNKQDTLAQKEASLNGVKHSWLLRWLLKKTRQVIAHRESLRLDRGLHFGYFRSMLHTIGSQLVSDGVLDDKNHVFLLTIEELNDFRQGSTANTDLNELAKLREAQRQSWAAAKPPGKLFTSGSVYANQLPIKSGNQQSSQNSVLQGVGCSSGKITAPALVVSDPNNAGDVSGKILVSESTDPGWVFLMTLSAGLVSERGSLLSHTAIIGRELNIPTVVNAKDATALIKTGDLISIDGTLGTVQLASDQTESQGD